MGVALGNAPGKSYFSVKLLPTLLLAALCSIVSAEPVFDPAKLHLPQMPLHDPFIVADASSHTYFLYTSNVPAMSGTPGVGTMAYTSQDLLNWERPRVVFLVPPTAFATAGGWAPEVHPYHGRYYLFTTLHDESKTLVDGPDRFRTYVRGTIAAVSDSLSGPFTMLTERGPVPPADFMTLDGTLYLDRQGAPWMVYAHEWIQKGDGTMEAVPLKPDLSGAAGAPIFLFKGSDAPWLDATLRPSTQRQVYVTDGPELFRTRTGTLLMLWSSYENGSYVQAIARSKSGELPGPWEQLEPLVKNDSGHGMLFHTFEGQLMLVLHHPFHRARGKLYEIADRGDHLEILRERTDLDHPETGGVAHETHQTHE